MKKLVLVLAGVALSAACSDARDSRSRADDNLTRPLAVARVDTTQSLAPVEQQVTPPSDTMIPAKPPKARPKAPKTAPVPPPEDTTPVQGYAPAPAPEAAVPDTAAVFSDDSTPAAASETAAASAPDTVSDSGTASKPDSATAVASEPELAGIGADVSSPAEAEAFRTLPIGTEIHAALDDSINSRTDTAGRVVTAVVMENVAGSDGRTLIAAGAPVRFVVTRLSPARSKGSQGRLALQVEGVGVAGELRKVSADVRPVPHELRGRGVGTSEAAKVGVGAAGGAVLGRVLGGNTKGAVIGGVVGAAGGAVVASQTASRDVVVKARTPVTFVLTEPLVAR